MTLPNPDLCIELKLAQTNDMKEAIKVIRAYTSEPISRLSESIKKDEPFIKYNFLASKFYDGWKDLYKLTNDLKDHGISVLLLVNGKPEDLSYVELLKKKVMGIKREDIY
jgi:hypothetical protein